MLIYLFLMFSWCFFLCVEEPLMTMQTSKDVVAMFHFVCQKVPHDNTNLSTLFTLETVGMPVKAERLE